MNEQIEKVVALAYQLEMDPYSEAFAKLMKDALKVLKKGEPKTYMLSDELKSIVESSQKSFIEACIEDSGPLEWYYSDLTYSRDGSRCPYLSGSIDSLVTALGKTYNIPVTDDTELEEIWNKVPVKIRKEIAKVANAFTLKYFDGHRRSYHYYCDDDWED